jgi:hypothetical protein
MASAFFETRDDSVPLANLISFHPTQRHLAVAHAGGGVGVVNGEWQWMVVAVDGRGSGWWIWMVVAVAGCGGSYWREWLLVDDGCLKL